MARYLEKKTKNETDDADWAKWYQLDKDNTGQAATWFA